MRPFERSDLGRLYVSAAGRRDFIYAGDASLDGVQAAGSVSFNGSTHGVPSAGRTWTGAFTVRPGDILLSLSEKFAQIDLLVVYGEQGCLTGPYDRATLIERAIVSGEQWSLLAAMESAQRAPVTAACSFTAANVRRARAGDLLRRQAPLNGTVAALDRAGGRLYALCASPAAGGAISLRLAWATDAGDWASAAVAGVPVAEPTTVGSTYARFSVRVWGDSAYISTGTDLFSVRLPADGEASPTLRAGRVRPLHTASAPVVGLHRMGGRLLAPLTSGVVWGVDYAGGASVVLDAGGAVSGVSGDDEQAVVYGPSGGVVLRAGGDVQRFTWDGTLAWAGAAGGNLVIITLGGEVWIPRLGRYLLCATLGGSLVAAAEDGGITYAVASSGVSGSRLFVSVGNLGRWAPLDGKPHDLLCLLPVQGGVLAGGHDLLAGANRSGGIATVVSCRAAGGVYLASSSELLIVG